MASFEKKSRYAGVDTSTVTDRRGREVTIVTVPEPPVQETLGTHLRRQGQRLDHLSQKYLGEATAFWRICELNDAMTADVLAEAPEVEIPTKKKK
jgi:hypothetical protein